MPPSPSTRTSWPSEYERSCIDSARLRSSLSGSSENIGTARRDSDIALISGMYPIRLAAQAADVLGDVLRELLDRQEGLRLVRRGVRERHRALLEADPVAEHAVRPGRQAQRELGRLGELSRQLAGAQQEVAVERVLAAVAGHRAAVVDDDVDLRVAALPAAQHLEQIGRRLTARGEQRHEREHEQRPPHTTTSWAPATSRRNCGVDIAPCRRA